MSERVLNSVNMPDWLDKLKAAYDNPDLPCAGGESSNEAMNRIVWVVEDAAEDEEENIIIIAHGNMRSLLLK